MDDATRASTRWVAWVLAGTALAASAFGLGRLSASDGSEERHGDLPRCSELAGTSFEASRATTGCITADGAALEGYRFECLDPSSSPVPDAAVDVDPQVVLIPDAGLVGTSGQPWQELAELAAFHRTPFNMLRVGIECAWLRSIPSDWPVRATCDLDEVRIDFVSLQGCESQGVYHPAVGRSCVYQDGDQTSSWEQWWFEGLDPGGPVQGLETAGPPETWTLIDSLHRDDRCEVPPDDWPEDWRGS